MNVPDRRVLRAINGRPSAESDNDPLYAMLDAGYVIILAASTGQPYIRPFGPQSRACFISMSVMHCAMKLQGAAMSHCNVDRFEEYTVLGYLGQPPGDGMVGSAEPRVQYPHESRVYLRSRCAPKGDLVNRLLLI